MNALLFCTEVSHRPPFAESCDTTILMVVSPFSTCPLIEPISSSLRVTKLNVIRLSGEKLPNISVSESPIMATLITELLLNDESGRNTPKFDSEYFHCPVKISPVSSVTFTAWGKSTKVVASENPNWIELSHSTLISLFAGLLQVNLGPKLSSCVSDAISTAIESVLFPAKSNRLSINNS